MRAVEKDSRHPTRFVLQRASKDCKCGASVRNDLSQIIVGKWVSRNELIRDPDDRLVELIAAENQAFAMLKKIEDRAFIRPGRTEKEIEQDILALAETEFGVRQHWHKRIVRAGINTLAVFAENPPVRTIEDDDIVFLDLGPVFENWEADVGKTYAIGNDSAKHALAAELPRQFAMVKSKLVAEPDITGASLFHYAKHCASLAGWKFGGAIAGHIVAEFPHARLPGERQVHHISAENPLPLSALDPLGRKRYWIIEIHLVSPDGKFGGFYERLAYGSCGDTDARPRAVGSAINGSNE